MESSQPPNEPKRYGITLGAGLFPPEKPAGSPSTPKPARIAASPAATPATQKMKPAVVVDLDVKPPTARAAVMALDADDVRLQKAELKQWLIPLGAIVVGWGIQFGIAAIVAGVQGALVLQPVLLILLGIKLLVALLICAVALRWSDGTVGNGFLFFLRVTGAVFLAFPGTFIPPWLLGQWVIEPLIFWFLTAWFLEFTLMEGFVVSLLYCLLGFGTIHLIVTHLMGGGA